MKIERTQNTVKGSVWGIIERISNMLLPFLVRSVMLYKLGIEYLGLNSLFTSVLQVLNITELGFASASVYAMYKPIAEDDYNTVGAILQYLKKVYITIGIAILITGMLLIPFLPKLINGDIPDTISIYVLYLVYLLNTSISYFFAGYKSALLSALQCRDVISKVAFGTGSILALSQCLLLFLFPNYYAYSALIPLFTILNNLIKAKIVDTKYSVFLVKEKISNEIRIDIKSRIFPLLGTKLAVVLLNSADTLVISAFLGLAETAMYNNYYYIMKSVQSLVWIIHSSMSGGVGNALVVDSKDKIVENFKRIHFMNGWLTAICCSCFLGLYQPFMEAWVGKTYMLPYGMVILFTTYFYTETILRAVVVYKDAAGIWKQDMFRTYLSCTINIILNIFTVRYIGLYGVIGSSVFVGLVINPWIAKTLYIYVFERSPKEFYLKLIKNFIITIIAGGTCAVLCKHIPGGISGIMLRLLFCIIVTNAFLYVLYHRDVDYISSKQWLLKKLSNKNINN